MRTGEQNRVREYRVEWKRELSNVGEKRLGQSRKI